MKTIKLTDQEASLCRLAIMKFVQSSEFKGMYSIKQDYERIEEKIRKELLR